MTMTCRQCSRHLPNYAAFCPRCGQKAARPNRVLRLMVALGLLGGLGFFLLIFGVRSASSRSTTHYQQYPEMRFEPTHSSWPRSGSGEIRVVTPTEDFDRVKHEWEV